MYLTYESYLEMGGTLDETTFVDLEYEARTYIDYVTYNRLQNETVIPDKVIECIYHLIKLLAKKLEALNTDVDTGSSTATNGTIESQSNDGVSVRYNVMSAKDVLDSIKPEINDMINMCLQGVRNSLGKRLLYKGLYPDE